MSGYLLDTNILSDMIRNPGGGASRRAGEQAGVCTSIVVAAEMRYGCEKKGSARLTEKVERLLATIPVLPLETPADLDYGAIRTALEAAGTPIGGNDLLIAAQARALGLTLVTANAGEFRRVPGLKVENWLV